MRIFQQFWNCFNNCVHDWETIEYGSVNSICRDLKYDGYSGYDHNWLTNRICLKCHVKDLQIDQCKEYIKNKIEVEKSRQKLAQEILQKENNANS